MNKDEFELTDEAIERVTAGLSPEVAKEKLEKLKEIIQNGQAFKPVNNELEEDELTDEEMAEIKAGRPRF